MNRGLLIRLKYNGFKINALGFGPGLFYFVQKVMPKVIISD